MGFLIALFVLLLVLLIVSMPLILEARVRAGLRGAVVRAVMYVFGLVPIPLRLTVHLFSEPYFTLRFGRKEIPLLQKKTKGGELGLLKGVRLLHLSTVTTVGIENDPCNSVIAAGTAATALTMLTARFAESGTAKARPARTPMFRMNIRLSALLFLPEMVLGLLRARRIARRKAANNKQKANEKRTSYASG